MYVLAPVLILNESNIELSELNIFCCIFTMLSCFLLTHRFQGKKGIKFIYIILFFMTYIALVFGNNNLFDFIVKKLFQYYEYNNLTESYQYEKLWNIWANDLSRNLMYVYAFFYSLLTTLIFFIFVKILRKKKKNQKH